MMENELVQEAVAVLQEAAPTARVILFGSRARGDASERSDLDFLVVEPGVANRWDEMLRLKVALQSFPVSVDIVVQSDETFQYWRETPNTLSFAADKEGRVFEPLARAS